MPLRVTNQVEKNVRCIPTLPVVVATNVSTDVLSRVATDLTLQKTELSSRYIQNEGANDAYYAFGYDATPQEHCGTLYKTQQLDCSNHGDRVSIYSTGGTTIAITLLERRDLSQYGNIIQPSPL